MSAPVSLSVPKIVAGPVIETASVLDQFDFSSDGNVIITRSRGGDIQYWSARTGAEVTPSSIDPFQPQVQSWGQQGQLPIKIEDTCATLLSTGQVHDLRRFDGSHNVFAASPDGRYLAGGNGSGYIRMLDLEQSKWVFLYGHNTSMNNHMYQNSIEYLEFDFRSELLISLSEEEVNPRLWAVNADRAPTKFSADDILSLSNSVSVPVPGRMARFSPTRQQLIVSAPGLADAQKLVRTFAYKLA